MKNIVSQRNLSVHKEHEILRKLEAAGLGDIEAQSVIQSKGNKLAEKVVEFIRRGGYEATVSQKTTRAIMGENFLGIEKAIQHLGANPTERELGLLTEVPFTEGVLEECKDTHILVAAFPMSILEIRDKVEKKLFYSYEDAWYNKQSFAKDKGEASWHLIRKNIVPNSTSKTWNEQQALLAENEETPQARIMVYAIIGHYLATGERLFKNIYARCSDLDSGGYRVDVGRFDSAGFTFTCWWDDRRYDSIGLSSVWKSENLNS
ncbi:MAG: hypothetical protein V3T98_01900 [Candidatus Paceibacterota bacterium]